MPGAYGDVGRHPDYRTVAGMLVVRLDAPLFYANAAPVAEGVKRLVGAAEPVPRVVVLDAGANQGLDITTSETLERLVVALRSVHVDFALAEVRQPVLDAAARAGLLDTIGADRVFHTIDEAVAALGAEPG